jgi:hypothetical protein
MADQYAPSLPYGTEPHIGFSIFPERIRRNWPLPKPLVVHFDPEVYKDVVAAYAYIISTDSPPMLLFDYAFGHGKRIYCQSSDHFIWHENDIVFDLPPEKRFQYRVCLLDANNQVIVAVESPRIRVVQDHNPGHTRISTSSPHIVLYTVADLPTEPSERHLHTALNGLGAFI